MPAGLNPGEAVEELRSQPIEFFGDALIRDDTENIWLTNIVLGVILGLFGIEIGLMLLWKAPSTQAVVNYFFIHHPSVTWPVAPFLHRGIRHVVANMAFIYFAAPVEQCTTKLRYLGLLLLAGFLPVYADGLKLDVLGSEPHIAAYGASGFAFGLLGYGLTVHIGTGWRLTPRWWLIVVIGVAAVITVIGDVVLAIGDPVSVNLGHLGGLLVGLCFGYLDCRS